MGQRYSIGAVTRDGPDLGSAFWGWTVPKKEDLPDGRPWLISCDESGTDGARYYGFGSLWMSWDRRGDFLADLREIGGLNGVSFSGPDGAEHEFKWPR